MPDPKPPNIAQVSPQAIEAEQATLGAALMSTTAAELVMERLERDDYLMEAHRLVFSAIGRLAKRGLPADVITLPDELRRMERFDAAGGLAYITQLVESVASSGHVEHYIGMVRDASIKRRLADGLSVAREAALNGSLSSEVLATVERLAARERSRQPLRLPATMSAQDLMALDLPPPQWAVPGILPAGLVIIAGKPKTGKSWLALEILLAVAAGGVALGKIPTEQGRCLYLALEDTKIRLQDRMRLLLGDAACPSALHLTTEWPRSEDGGRLALLDWFKRYPDTRLVVVDTLTRMRSARSRNGNVYEEDYAAISSLKSVADQHGATLVLVHHLRKMAADDPLDSVSGSLGLTGAADGILVLKRERGQADASLYVTGRDVEENDLALAWDPHAAWTIMGGAAEFRDTREQAEMLAALRALGGSGTPSEVADSLGKQRNAIKLRLWRLSNNGVLRVNNGRYSLIPSEDVQNPVTPVTAVTRGESSNRTEPFRSETGVSSVPEDPSASKCENSSLRLQGQGEGLVTAVTGSSGIYTPDSEEDYLRLQRLQGRGEGLVTAGSAENNSETPAFTHEIGASGPENRPDLFPNLPAVTAVTRVTLARAHMRELARQASFPEISLSDGTQIRGLYVSWEDFAEGAGPDQLAAATVRLERILGGEDA